MEDRTIHPSMKLVWATYALALITIGVGVWAYSTYAQEQQPWLMAIPCVALLVPIRMHLLRRMVSVRLHDYHLTIERGFLSRTRRTVDMAKIQDVTVRQSLGQRLLGVGDLMLESAGESSGMGIANVDDPRGLADAIIAGSKHAAVTRTIPEPRPGA